MSKSVMIKKDDLLKVAKPILFNTEMVSAILCGRKTQTRRIAKEDKFTSGFKASFSVGDILYVREAFSTMYFCGKFDSYIYRADSFDRSIKYKPSIHMPKEAARIFLKITGVRLQKLQDISADDCISEGIHFEDYRAKGADFVKGEFSDLWDSTVKKSDLSIYGWDANPFVWVYQFEVLGVDEL